MTSTDEMVLIILGYLAIAFLVLGFVFKSLVASTGIVMAFMFAFVAGIGWPITGLVSLGVWMAI